MFLPWLSPPLIKNSALRRGEVCEVCSQGEALLLIREIIRIQKVFIEFSYAIKSILFATIADEL